MPFPPDIRRVEGLDDPALGPYRTLRRPEEHRRAGIFVAEGEKVVDRLLASSLEVLSLLVSESRLPGLAAHPGFLRAPRPVVYTAPEPLVREIIGYRLHQCIMAIGRVPAEADLAALPSPRLLVALDGLQHAENVGVIVRNASAFGASGVLAAPTGCSPYLRRAVRNSMGSVFTMPVRHPPSMHRALADLRARGTRVIAADIRGTIPVAEANLRGDCCLVLGNEEQGVSAEVLSVCDATAAIPMQRGTDSLNVANAAAVVLYEAARQRGFAG